VLEERKELQLYVVKLVLLTEIGVKLSLFLSLHVWGMFAFITKSTFQILLIWTYFSF